MTGRVATVRGHNAFQELARSRHRGRSGPIRVSFTPPVDRIGQVAVAYAIGRKVGGAVERNRCRRRLRSIVAKTVQDLAAGAYLVSVGAGALDMDFKELQERLTRAMRNASESL